jgi:DNA-nicking Smr family endonuclease
MTDDPLPPVELPISGELDLHTFRPRDLGSLIPDYLAACRDKGIYRVRIVHGKGTGQLRQTVRAILSRLPEVAFEQAGELEGSWGATIVWLRREEKKT